MNMKTRSRFLLSLGVFTILLWVLYIPDLVPLPFGEHKGIKTLIDDVYESPIKDLTIANDMSKTEIERKLMLELQFSWFFMLFTIILGIISGFCILSGRKHCRIFVIVFASFYLALRLIGHLKHYPEIGRSLYTVYVFLLPRMPFMVIRNDILSIIILTITVIALTRPSIANQFK